MTKRTPMLTLVVGTRTSDSMPLASESSVQQPCWDCKQVVWISPAANALGHHGVLCRQCASTRGHLVAPGDTVEYFFENDAHRTAVIGDQQFQGVVADVALAARAAGHLRLCLVCLQGFNEGECPRCANGPPAEAPALLVHEVAEVLRTVDLSGGPVRLAMLLAVAIHATHKATLNEPDEMALNIWDAALTALRRHGA